MSNFKNISLVIPAHNPGPELIDICSVLSSHGFGRIVVINDGSTEDLSPVFRQVESIAGVTVLRHETNLGKGAALKTAFRHIETINHGLVGSVLTLDADGQHGIDDVVAVAEQGMRSPDQFVIGVRSFKQDVPLRSRIGNKLTRHVLRWINRIDLEDTQSGLRCFPLAFMYKTLAIPADRYEFELECLLLAKREKLTIVQQPIQTIYIDDNASSHFRPVLDSLRIYMVFARFAVISLASFVLDITLFTVIHSFSGHIVGSTYLARLLSGSFNFYFNKHTAFRSDDRRRYWSESFGYILLAVFIATVSGMAVAWLTGISGWSAPLVKILVDTQLFVVSFLVQRFVIFRK